MSYEIIIDGQAQLWLRDGAGKIRVEDETLRLPEIPIIRSDGPAVVDIREISTDQSVDPRRWRDTSR